MAIDALSGSGTLLGIELNTNPVAQRTCYDDVGVYACRVLLSSPVIAVRPSQWERLQHREGGRGSASDVGVGCWLTARAAVPQAQDGAASEALCMHTSRAQDPRVA